MPADFASMGYILRTIYDVGNRMATLFNVNLSEGMSMGEASKHFPEAMVMWDKAEQENSRVTKWMNERSPVVFIVIKDVLWAACGDHEPWGWAFYEPKLQCWMFF